MNLKERLGRAGKTGDTEIAPLAIYGLARNPFPAASQTSGHPRLPTSADRQVEQRLNDFLESFDSKVLVIEGTQGTGKTNLLQEYERELPSLDEGDGGVFVVHYYPDPEPALDKLLASIIQELGPGYLSRLVAMINDADEDVATEALDSVRSPEFRQMMRRLLQLSGDELDIACSLGIEWMRGMRIFKRHTETLGIYQRLDTTESRIGAMRDLMSVSERAGALRALFLLLDELEKQDDVNRSSIHIVRYLASLRALIDALPHRFFLMLAITPSARATYRQYYPALASRFEGSIVRLNSIETLKAAKDLYEFYLNEERHRTQQTKKASRTAFREPLTDHQIENLYKAASFDAQKSGGQLTARGWLQQLHATFSGLAENVPVHS